MKESKGCGKGENIDVGIATNGPISQMAIESLDICILVLLRNVKKSVCDLANVKFKEQSHKEKVNKE